MPQFFSKLAKIGFCVLVPTLFMSGTKMDKGFVSANAAEANTLQLTGSLNKNLATTIGFETAIETTSKGTSFSILKLKLENSDEMLPHAIEFLIAKENSKQLLSKGTYKVSSGREGLLNYFDGVFGFADIEALGELPLFAKNGEIRIDKLNNTNVEGSIKIQMRDAGGKSINIHGNFIATK